MCAKGYVFERSATRRADDCSGSCGARRVGGALAEGPDGPALGPGHGRGPDRKGCLHLARPGTGGAAQLQRRRVRLLGPEYSGGRPPTFTLPERRQIKKIALSRPVDHELPFSTWSLSKLAEFLVAEGVVDDISHEGLRLVLREEGVSFQVIKTWKQSNDPDFEAKKNRVLELYDIADGKAKPKKGIPPSSSAWTSSGH